jgi:quercetin dioxygenase-like cupin family protein
MMAENDRVVVRYSFQGTHQGTLFGLIPATGKSASWHGIAIWRIANGQIAERWSVDNNVSLLQQIGIVPTIAGPGGEAVGTPTPETHDDTHDATAEPAVPSPDAGSPVAVGSTGVECINELPATFIQAVDGATFLGCGNMPQLPGQTFYLARFTLQPGDTLERHWHPGIGLIGYVESGIGSLMVLEGEVWLVRATPPGEVPAEPEIIPLGVEILAYPGDWVWYPEGAVIIEGNAGDTVVSTLVAGFAVSGQQPINFLPAEPVIAEPLADGIPGTTPGQIMRLARFTLPPGSSVASHQHPGAELAYIQEGRVGMRLYSGEAFIRRAGSSTDEPMPLNEDVIFEAGDQLFGPEPFVHDLWNAGNEPAVILVTVLLDETQEPVIFLADTPIAGTPEAATPEASPVS